MNKHSPRYLLANNYQTYVSFTFHPYEWIFFHIDEKIVGHLMTFQVSLYFCHIIYKLTCFILFVSNTAY